MSVALGSTLKSLADGAQIIGGCGHLLQKLMSLLRFRILYRYVQLSAFGLRQPIAFEGVEDHLEAIGKFVCGVVAVLQQLSRDLA